MAVTNYEDVTLLFNKSSKWTADVSGWDHIIVQLVGPSSSLSFQCTNDGAAVQGSSEGSAANATNFVLCQGTNIATGAALTASAADGVFKFTNIGKYFQIIGTSATATKILIKYSKIR